MYIFEELLAFETSTKETKNSFAELKVNEFGSVYLYFQASNQTGEMFFGYDDGVLCGWKTRLTKSSQSYDTENGLSSKYSTVKSTQEWFKEYTDEVSLETSNEWKEFLCLLDTYKFLTFKTFGNGLTSRTEEKPLDDYDLENLLGDLKRSTFNFFTFDEHPLLELPYQEVASAKRQKSMYLGGDDFAGLMLQDTLNSLEDWLTKNKRVVEEGELLLLEASTDKNTLLSDAALKGLQNLKKYKEAGASQKLTEMLEDLKK